MEARCQACGNPMGDLIDVIANRKDLGTEYCDDCLEKYHDEIYDVNPQPDDWKPEERGMTGEIDRDFYCLAGFYNSNHFCEIHHDKLDTTYTGCSHNCKARHRKHPTPGQFLAEYGRDVSDDMPVWILHSMSNKDSFGHMKESDIVWSGNEWFLTTYKKALGLENNQWHRWGIIVVACTPFGKPDNDWRPEKEDKDG